MEYADLYLIHFPGTQKLAADNEKNTELRHATWESMVELYDRGVVNAIGVSNFTNYHLDLLMERNHGVVPAVNQVYFIPYHNYTKNKSCYVSNSVFFLKGGVAPVLLSNGITGLL